jgi:hypothetical protein
MDIGKIVVYEHIFELVVTLPNSDIPTGLVMGIRSASSEQCKAIMRKHTNDQAQGNRAKQKRITAEQLENNELESVAASIAWWRWDGDATYNGEKPEFSMKIAVEILGEVNWLYAQVKEAGINLENFMPKNLIGSANTLISTSDTTSSETKETVPGGNVMPLSAKTG